MSNIFTHYTEAELDQLISDGIEENIHLDYKGSQSLGKSAGKKDEIGKDVSAFANSDGGVIVYGVSEFNDLEKRHLPEKIDAINRTDFSKEWLEQVINSKVRPKIPDLIIRPIDISRVPNGVVYVVEIPQSHTPHQASDKRYYRRFNFESVPMDDYEIGDIRNRRQDYKPLILIDYEIATSHMVYLTVKNVGDAIAYDVEFDFPPDVKWIRDGDATPSLFANGVKAIPPGRVYRFLWNLAHRLFGLNDPSALRICAAATYTHGESGRRIRDEFEIDLEPHRFNSTLKSDVETLSDMLREHLGKLISELKMSNEHLRELSSIAGATGLDLSNTTLRNLHVLSGAEGDLEKLPARNSSYRVFKEVLQVDGHLADSLEHYFHWGQPESLSDIEGMSPELIERLERYFYWE